MLFSASVDPLASNVTVCPGAGCEGLYVKLASGGVLLRWPEAGGTSVNSSAAIAAAALRAAERPRCPGMADYVCAPADSSIRLALRASAPLGLGHEPLGDVAEHLADEPPEDRIGAAYGHVE